MSLCKLVMSEAGIDVLQRAGACCDGILCIEKTVFGWRVVVSGSEKYEVNFYLGEGEWSAECNCGYFEIHGEPCKHIVAAAMVIDQKLNQ